MILLYRRLNVESRKLDETYGNFNEYTTLLSLFVVK